MSQKIRINIKPKHVPLPVNNEKYSSDILPVVKPLMIDAETQTPPLIQLVNDEKLIPVCSTTPNFSSQLENKGKSICSTTPNFSSIPDVNKCFHKCVLVTYDNKKYLVLTMITRSSDQEYEFPLVIDFDDYHKIQNITWFRTNTYINSRDTSGDTGTYIHHKIMDHAFDGKFYVDHINRIHHDNRKANLRLATQTEQNWNQTKRKRTTKLPENCGIDPNDIPTNIEYHPKCASTPECFEVVIKVGGKRVFRKKPRKVYNLQQCKN